MKTILLHVFEDSGFESRLQVALDLARGHQGHLTCVQPTTQFAPMSFGPLGGDFVTGINFEDMDAAERSHREKIEKRLKEEDVSWDWQTGLGDPATLLTERSRLADLVVVSQSYGKRNAGDEPLPIAGDIAVHAHCAILVVPVENDSFDCQGPMVVAWNGSAEAAKAVRLALPMLKLASDVHLVTVGDDDSEFPHVTASTFLARHGVSTVLHELKGKGSEASEVIAEFAVEQDAAALVMGAYGHSRLRETLFGGVTKNLLGDAKIPLLMGH
ncbi:universal stress protein [Parasphingorhabdus litoris]|uniref:Universal stress protein n=1 Tax=Parasphingorhabdus litoris TaxID=394733 RepID=A0ABP3KVD9_9SPHN|nr:universal stress protein [Parasphingorhabdus litoris]